MKLGYACINLSIEGSFRTITVKKASTLSQSELIRQLKDIALHNLYTTYKIICWNVKNNILIYRMTSDMIALATHPLNQWQWYNDIDVLNMCAKIKSVACEYNVRLSFHPSQFVVLNSERQEVINNSIAELNYHAILSDLLGNDTLILHVGGKAGGIESASKRFEDTFHKLPHNIKSKIVLENDDKSFNLDDVLNLAKKIQIPVCFDYHHDRCLPSKTPITAKLNTIIGSWKGKTPKLHISSGKSCPTDRKHSDFIAQEDFKHIIDITAGQFDIMVEAKSKDLAVLNLTNGGVLCVY